MTKSQSQNSELMLYICYLKQLLTNLPEMLSLNLKKSQYDFDLDMDLVNKEGIWYTFSWNPEVCIVATNNEADIWAFINYDQNTYVSQVCIAYIWLMSCHLYLVTVPTLATIVYVMCDLGWTSNATMAMWHMMVASIQKGIVVVMYFIISQLLQSVVTIED